MKCKQLTKFISLVLVFSLGLSTVAFATYTSQTIDDLLAPYQKVIDKINEEFQCAVYIPEGQKSTVYDNLKDTSLADFEADLRSQLENTLNYTSPLPQVKVTENNSVNSERVLSEDDLSYGLPPANTSESLIVTPLAVTRSVREDITQKRYLDAAAYITLYSTVFSASGTAGTFSYSNIDKLTYNWDRGSGIFFYYPLSMDYSLDSSKKNCTVELECQKRNDDGLFLTGFWTVTVTFNAG